MKIAEIEAELAAGKHVDLRPDGTVVLGGIPPGPEPCELCGKTEHDPRCGLCVKRGSLATKLRAVNDEIRILNEKRDALRKQIRRRHPSQQGGPEK